MSLFTSLALIVKLKGLRENNLILHHGIYEAYTSAIRAYVLSVFSIRQIPSCHLRFQNMPV